GFNTEDGSHISGEHNTVTVMQNNGSGWGNVGMSPISNASYPCLAVDPNNVPYIAYFDYYQNFNITVMKYVGGNWVFVGSPGISSKSINMDGGITASGGAVAMAMDANGTPYIAYTVSNNIIVMKFSGGSNASTYVTTPGTYTVTVTNASTGCSATSAVATVSTSSNLYINSPFGTNYQTGQSINIPFTTCTTYVAGNVFTAQLSDASG